MTSSLSLLFSLLTLLSLLTHHFTLSSPTSFEGFGDESDGEEDHAPINLPPPPIIRSILDAPDVPDVSVKSQENIVAPSINNFVEYWDEDEFEGVPVHQENQESASDYSNTNTRNPTDGDEEKSSSDQKGKTKTGSNLPPFTVKNYLVEIVCVSFLIVFVINYFTGKKENEKIALSWAAKFATKDSIFEKNFSLLGTGDGKDTPLLLKEGQNVFKFYASGRRYCSGMLATMELQSRHDLISRVYNMVVPCKDEITFEVFMNDDGMDQVVFAMGKKKLVKGMHKECGDLVRYGSVVNGGGGGSGRKWVVDDLLVVSESKEVAGDLINETVLDQVFGDKAFEKFGKAFISMHISDRYVASHRKMLVFKFALPDANHMADMTILVALVPYYIDLIGRYKLSSQARSKTDAARVKAAQEAYKELQYARQEALQKKKLEKKKMMEEAEAKLSAEALRKRDAKDRARQMKKGAPKVKMTRAH